MVEEWLVEVEERVMEVDMELVVKFFEVSYYQKNFQPPTVPNSQDRGGMKMPYDFFVYICDF